MELSEKQKVLPEQDFSISKKTKRRLGGMRRLFIVLVYCYYRDL